MIFWIFLLILLLIVSVFTIWEYRLLRKMVPSYYQQGPFAKTEEFILNENKEQVLKKMSSKHRIVIRQIDEETVLLNFKPPRFLPLFGTNTQRIILYFSKELSTAKVKLEIRPFYSAYLIGAFIALLSFSTVVLGRTTSELSEIIIISLIGLGGGFVVANVFHAFPDMNNIKKLFK